MSPLTFCLMFYGFTISFDPCRSVKNLRSLVEAVAIGGSSRWCESHGRRLRINGC